MLFWYFLDVFELLSDSLTAIYVELHWCPSHHSILLTQGPIWEIFAKKFWELAILKNELFLSRPFWIFFSKKKIFFCFIPMKISPNLYGRMDGSKFWCFPWFPENSLLCVILRYTVYIRQCFALHKSKNTFFSKVELGLDQGLLHWQICSFHSMFLEWVSLKCLSYVGSFRYFCAIVLSSNYK